MELVSFAKDVIRNVAEQAASYRLGQSALRYADRALWVIEKCARWAVPPPLDADERPQPELVRPLPWIFFLAMLVTLRITRESISLINLILGKPPLRSADVVMYIQSKRRYLRTLKYQGNRNIRARRAPSSEPWYSGFKALFEFTMCFRRSQNCYGNNNTTRVSNNDEVLVVKRNKPTRETAGAVAAAPGSDTPMERLIEKMMVELDADSDDDSSYTLTNATSLRSLRSEESELDQDGTLENLNTTMDTSVSSEDTTVANNVQSPKPTEISVATSTPNKSPEMKNGESEKEIEVEIKKTENETQQMNTSVGKIALSERNHVETEQHSPENDRTDSPQNEKKTIKYSPKETTNKFLQTERCSPQKQPKQRKFANGRAMSVPNKKKGLTNQRRDSDTPLARVPSADDSF